MKRINLEKTLIINQDFIGNKVATPEEEVKKLKKRVYEKNSKIKETLKMQIDRSRPSSQS